MLSTSIYLIFAGAAVLAFTIGAASGYFFYRSRHREAMVEIEAVEQDLREREKQLRRLKYETTTMPASGPTAQTEAQYEYEKLRDELEQRELDLNILRQDYELETKILRQEIDQLRSGHDDRVNDRRRRLEQEKAELEALRSRLESRETELQQREERLDDEHETVVQEAEYALTARQRAESQEEELRRRQAELEAQKAHLEAQQAQLQAQQQQIGAQQQQIEERRATLEGRQAQLETQFTELEDREQAAIEAVPLTEDRLVKRLRQQIKLQEEELEQVRALLAQTRPRPQLRPTPSASDATDDSQAHLAAADHVPDEPAAEVEDASFPTFSPLSSLVDAPARRMDRGPGQRAELPRRHDPLTLISGIDADMEAELHAMGISTFEQLARWSSADVRRISEGLGIERTLIQNHWILEAQSLLFERA